MMFFFIYSMVKGIIIWYHNNLTNSEIPLRKCCLKLHTVPFALT